MEDYAEEILHKVCGEWATDEADWKYDILHSILYSSLWMPSVSTKEQMNMITDLALTDKKQLIAFIEQYGTPEAKNILEPFFRLNDSRIGTILKILREQFRRVVLR
jgi:hypothetical protein